MGELKKLVLLRLLILVLQLKNWLQHKKFVKLKRKSLIMIIIISILLLKDLID